MDKHSSDHERNELNAENPPQNERYEQNENHTGPLQNNSPNEYRNDDRRPPYHENYDERARYERNRYQKRPWYNQGWVWLIVAVIAIVVLFFGLSGVAEETAKVNQSIQDQTSAIKEQNTILQSINQGINGLTSAIKEGFNSIVLAIKDAVIAIIDSVRGMF